MNKLILGDCVEELEKLTKDGVKFDCIIADVPYGHKTTACTWDSIIPLDLMWKAIDKVSHKQTTTLIFGKEPFSSKLRLSNIDQFKYDWIWKKPRGSDFLHAKFRPMSNYEIISVFSEASAGSASKNPMTYNPQFSQGTPRLHKGSNDNAPLLTNGKLKKQVYENKTGQRYPKRIIEFNNYVEVGQKLHPTQKPLDLLEYLVRTHSNEEDLVLDFCMGSGTTLLAAKNLNRNYIGIENNEEYYKIAEKRLK